jgi:glycosyltransferase involved in cell wall biosynthesis
MVVSAVNFTEGGPLTILKEFVTAACEMLPPEWNIVVFVHDRELLEMKRPRYIEIPTAKKSWLRRMYVEWFQFRVYANKFKPDLWISLHDITPRVGAIRQAVYCHNAMPFYRLRLRDIWLDPKAILFRYLYSIIYRINLKRNYAVVVQQSWLRKEFRRWVGSKTKIIVSHPVVEAPLFESAATRSISRRGVTFLYPTLPRIFKNVELICLAVQELERIGDWHSEVILTIDGRENRYAQWLLLRFGKLKTVRFAGRKTVQQMRALYGAADCLIFPSLMETWGLPITEAKRLGMPMLVANLPYAHETVGAYDRVNFIDVSDSGELASKMLAFQNKRCIFKHAEGVVPSEPFAANWRQLLSLLIEDLN